MMTVIQNYLLLGKVLLNRGVIRACDGVICVGKHF